MGEEEDTGSGFPTPKEMLGWLEREIADTAKAAELRIRDAARFVTAYALGEISADEAENGAYEYACRWGDALPGVHRSQGMPDEEILQKMDETRSRRVPARALGKKRYRGTPGAGR